ncbi:MAG: hypothetical protein ABSF92_01295 [Candidatus Acidiferrales bacterium]
MRFLSVKTVLAATGLACALGLAAPPLRAQGVRKDDIVVNSRGVPLAGATVRVCAMPASGQPCAPLAQIFSDAALTQALVNPATTDGLGNYFFYATPGRYMVEISGPGITTRQIPDVLLPNDPTAPSFSSVSSSGGISAFSLNLSGNLAVNGNAAVAGTLSGGTLNLTNQGTPPGAASTGTVNVYTKTDKKLYYADDTGAEIGPISTTTGAQTNVANTFTAAQNFDADVAMKGPNPWFDLRRYGGYASSSPPSATGSITLGSSTLTLSSALDFANGHGIVIHKAGPGSTLATPASVAVAPGGILNGGTTYTYQVVAEDYAGGLTAASTTASTTTGAATLGANTAIVTQCVRSGGTTTFTTSSNHNFANGQTVSVTGFNAGSGTFLDDCNGTFYIVSTPSSTTFTINQSGMGDRTDTSGGSAQVNAFNRVTWNYQAGALRYWVYRGGSLVGVSIGVDPIWYDYGYDLVLGVLPAYVPTSAPGSAQNGYLATTIVSGGGTTSLTLANAAGATVSSAVVLHDNSVNLLNAVAAAVSSGGGTVYFSTTLTGGNDVYPFNAATQLNSPTAGRQVRLLISGLPYLNQPFVLGSSYTMEGSPRNSGPSAFLYGYATRIGGSAFPLVYVSANPYKIQQYYKNLEFYALYNQQTGVYFDENASGGGSAGILFDDTSFTAGQKSYSALVIKGGFDFWFRRGVFSAQGATALGQPAVRFKNSSATVCGTSCQIAYRIRFDSVSVLYAGIQVDNLDNTSSGVTTSWDVHNMLYESGVSPLFRVNIGNNVWSSFFTFSHVDGADQAAGLGTPFVDMSGTSNISNVRFDHCLLTTSSQPLITGTAPSPFNLRVENSFGILNVPNYVATGSATSNPELAGTLRGLEMHSASPISILNGAYVGTPLPAPAAAPTLTAIAGGAVPVGTHSYSFSVVGWNGGESAQSPAQSVTTTTGVQTVNLTCSYSGAANFKGFNFYRDGYRAHSPTVTNPMATTCSWSDTFGFTDGTSPSQYNYASADFLNSSGVSADTVRVNGELVSAAPRSIHNVFLPGALTSAWTGATLTLDKAITVTRLQAQTKTGPSGCTTNAVVRLTDGTTPVTLTVSAAASDSGAISQNYAGGAALTVSVQTAASGCTTAPADANVVIQYRMQ